MIPRSLLCTVFIRVEVQSVCKPNKIIIITLKKGDSKMFHWCVRVFLREEEAQQQRPAPMGARTTGTLWRHHEDLFDGHGRRGSQQWCECSSPASLKRLKYKSWPKHKVMYAASKPYLMSDKIHVSPSGPNTRMFF